MTTIGVSNFSYVSYTSYSNIPQVSRFCISSNQSAREGTGIPPWGGGGGGVESLPLSESVAGILPWGGGDGGLRRNLFWINKRQTITSASRTICPDILEWP